MLHFITSTCHCFVIIVLYFFFVLQASKFWFFRLPCSLSTRFFIVPSCQSIPVFCVIFLPALFYELCLFLNFCLPAFVPLDLSASACFDYWPSKRCFNTICSASDLRFWVQTFPIWGAAPCLEFWCCWYVFFSHFNDGLCLYQSRSAIKFLEITLQHVFFIASVNLKLEACVGVLVRLPNGKPRECGASATVISAPGICLLNWVNSSWPRHTSQALCCINSL